MLSTAEPIIPTTGADHPLASTFVRASAMAWEPTGLPGIAMKMLYRDEASGRSTILFRMEPGAVVPLHEHTELEQTYMLEGSLEDEQGACFAGDFVWRPAGNAHVARAPKGALFLSVFLKPNRFAAAAPVFAGGADT